MTTRTASVAGAVDRISDAGRLDPVVGAVRRIVRSALRPGKTRDALHGVWLGHPLHPLLTDIPIGMWSAAGVLDLPPGAGAASSTLIGAGCVSFFPTAFSGWADWSELTEQQQRVGLVHALTNGAAFACFLGSLAARVSGSTVRGRLWSYGGLTLLTVGGYLGGHLSYRQAAGVGRAEDPARPFPEGWHVLGRLDEIPDGLSRRSAAGWALVVMRRGDHIDVLGDTCSHLGASLSEGTFRAEGGHGCVVCPWHGSTFRLADGGVIHGPATAPMPHFTTQVADGMVRISRHGDRSGG